MFPRSARWPLLCGLRYHFSLYALGRLVVASFARNLFCVVLVDREKVGETPVAIKTLSPVRKIEFLPIPAVTTAARHISTSL